MQSELHRTGNNKGREIHEGTSVSNVGNYFPIRIFKDVSELWESNTQSSRKRCGEGYVEIIFWKVGFTQQWHHRSCNFIVKYITIDTKHQQRLSFKEKLAHPSHNLWKIILFSPDLHIFGEGAWGWEGNRELVGHERGVSGPGTSLNMGEVC